MQDGCYEQSERGGGTETEFYGSLTVVVAGEKAQTDRREDLRLEMARQSRIIHKSDNLGLDVIQNTNKATIYLRSPVTYPWPKIQW